VPVPADCTVVVIALAGGAALEGCLASLAPRHAQCHVILGEGMGEPAAWRTRFPTVRFSAMPELTVPMRRERGIRDSHAPLVALIEDTSHPGPGWMDGLAAAFADAGVAAASGPVRIDPGLPARAQALGCTEYARFHPDRLSSVVSRLPGNNLAYRREAILEVLDGQGLLESEAHAALIARGHRLAMSPAMAVTYRAADPRGIRLGARFHHGRLYAAARSRDWPWPKRLAWTGAAALLLPLVLCGRSLAGMTSALRPGAWLPAGLWVCAMEAAWAAGEAAGYAAGGGSSPAQWR